MSQIQNILQFKTEIINKIEKLELTQPSPEQAEILGELKESISRVQEYFDNEYIDFETICNNLPDTIYLYVADKEGKTVFVTDVYTQMSGISRSEVIGENVFVINKEKKLYTNGILPQVFKKLKPVESIGTMVRTNTKVHLRGFPIFDSGGNLKYAVAYGSNIQQLEAVKDQMLKLKESQEKTASEVQYLRTQQIQDTELVVHSRSMSQAISTALAVAPTDATVLITGESGTGKEVVANQIFKASKRSDQPFIRVNCAAIPATLMESELFGYEPGSFTGASRTGKTGIFEMANGGTLLLDEIGEMSIQMQTKLLRVLQNHEITKVGASRAIPVDVRIIAATNKDLQQAIRNHEFREDLYYRLNVVPIHLPPLRERQEDIEPLIQNFLNHYNKKYSKQIDVYSDAMQLMVSYDWPGNIRELQNVIERLVVVNQSNVIDTRTVAMVLGLSEQNLPESEPVGCNLKQAVAQCEQRLIRRAMEEHSSQRKAAAALGIDHSTLIKKCRKYGI